MAGRSSTPEELELMEHLKNKDIVKFKLLLRRRGKHGELLVDPNHLYGDPYYMTCLGRAASEKENFEESAEFIEALLENGADPNIRFETHDSYAAIHFAAEKNNLAALKVLLRHSETKPNILNSRGRTALYLAALNLPKTETSFKFLAKHPKVSNKHDLSKLTAIGVAAKRNCKREILSDLLNHVQYLKTDDKKLLQDKYPDLELPDVLDELTDTVSPTQLYSFLDSKNVEVFKEKVGKDMVNVTDMLPMTFLQLACTKGYTDIVQLLIGLGADINATGKDEQRPPVHLSCFYGHFIILDILIKNRAKVNNVKQKTVLHSLFEGLCKKQSVNSDYRECFDYLLRETPKLNIPINFGNEFGHTALHYAILEDDNYYTKELLRHGAYIGAMNSFGKTPLDDIDPALLEEALDHCIQREETDMKSNVYTLKVNFSMLKPSCSDVCDSNSPVVTVVGKQASTNGESTPLKDLESAESVTKELPEMYPLYFISQTKRLRHLLKHPVFLIFLHLKWNRIRLVFYMNIIFYSMFVIFLTAHILCTNCDNGTATPICDFHGNNFVRTILIILTVILIFRELIQFIMLPEKLSFIKNLENWLELGIIITTIIILAIKCSTFVASLVLILSWTEMILQFGCIYKLAIYNEMMKRVSFNYLKFLIWYSPLIVAFTFSFYKLYHKEKTEKENSIVNSFQNITGESSTQEEEEDFYKDFFLSFIKTVVMMIGEFDASGMAFDDGSKIIFLLFVFMITIVLLNLLNGLAVSDTQAIKNDAELVTQSSKVKLVHNFESALFGNSLFVLNGWRKYFLKRVTLFPEAFSENCLTIVLSQNKKIGRYIDPRSKSNEEEFRPDQCCSIWKWRFGFFLEPSVLDEAKEIADKESMKKEDAEDHVSQLKHEIYFLKSEVTEIKNLLKELLNNENS